MAKATPPASALRARVQNALKPHADPARATKMQAYMKSEMPYLGVPMPVVRATFRELFRDAEFPSFEGWQDDVRDLYLNAQYREERYVALAIAGHRKAKTHQIPIALDLYEDLIVTGAWWDLVDEIATHLIPAVLKHHPKETKIRMRAFSRSDHLWKRRTAIIFQMRGKADTDFPFLAEMIAPAMSSKEFFLRKAIGWALREYSATNPDAVTEFVREHEEQLSPLSKREALRNIGKVRKRVP